MSIQVIYQSLPIAKEPRFRLQDGGLFIELDSPMPVADVWRLVDRGEIKDAKTLAALLLVQRRGFI